VALRTRAYEIMDKTFLEFFAGIGLVRLGLERQGWRCLFANDNDPEKVKIYIRNFGIDSINDEDVKLVKAKDVPDATLATASFPCQDLSEAGPHNGIRGPRSGLFWDFIRILQGMNASRPPLVLLENVKGFLTEKKGENLVLAIQALNKLDYVCDVIMIDGRHFVPQSRPRIFVVGILRKAATSLKLPGDSTVAQEHPFRPLEILQLQRDFSDLEWFNLELPPIPQQDMKLEQILDPPEVVPQSYWFSEKETNRHLEMMPTRHKEKVDSLVLQSVSSAATMYRRMRKGEQKAELRFDNNAGCLRSARGGSSKQFVVVIDQGKLRMRKLTIPELKRLMGLSETFFLPNDYNATYRALGDAVVVPVIEWAAKNLLNPLFERVSQTAVKVHA
jgi:DNA (cytosine-5)-methyltransferase 1